MLNRNLALPPVQVRSRKSVEQAIEGSIEVIRSSGWAGFTMPAVCRQAGVSVPLLHRRFGGKEELFLIAQESVLQRIESETTDAFSGPRWCDISAAETIDLATHALAGIFFRYAQLLRGFNERGAVDTRVRDRAEDTLRLKYRLFSERILEFEPEIGLEDPRIGVGVCFASIAAALNHEAKHGDVHSNPRNWDRLVAELASAARAYLLGEPGTLPDLTRTGHPPLRRAAVGEGTAERLIASGVDLLGQDNYEGLTAAAASHKAGFTVGALYTYFENKEELMLAVEAQALDQLVSDAGTLFGADPVAGADPVPAAVAATIALIDANPAATRVLIARRPARQTTEQIRRALDGIQRGFSGAITPGDDRSCPDVELARSVCFLVVYAVLTEYIPHEAFLTPEISTDRFRAEQARLCSVYLASLGALSA